MEYSNSPRSISPWISVKGGDNHGSFVVGQKADVGEHAGMGLAGSDVLAVKALIEADRFGEAFDAIIGVAAEATAPGFLL